MTMLIHDPVFLEHETGRHPERAERLRAIDAQLQQRGLIERCTPLTFAAIDQKSVRRLHSEDQYSEAKRVADAGGGFLDADTVVCPRSFEVALKAAGACCAAVDAVVGNKSKTALSLVRPPGHHATPDRSMGFCMFNNVAIAADRARRKHELNSVLIVDWDVHHGNGTQDIFYSDSNVTFVSIHRYGSGFYPGTGSADEKGDGAGVGRTINVPLRSNTSRKTYVDQFRSTVEAAATLVKPELVLVSAGFDAHVNDPIGGLGLETEDYVTLTETVLAVAKTHAAGRLVSCLEGGYDLTATAESVAAHLETLLAAD